ncbi:alpha/beta hydrolase [Amycolatopsis sp. QT-25]|uniref:alpha/beta hydrolase n=1 Tax=Amycolatopsis sp. QT-25 TaxID=3034022 RepID=UPI0023EDEF56|nr:alpha/beta fold hydrolase [Amycolatopsis sp. QT-25]WET78044.1 alpha/beta hydrolase [Amycolatopsis sp. QT-25]
MIALGVVVTLVGAVFGAAFAFQRKLIYLPEGGPPPGAAVVLPGGRDVTLTTSDGLSLASWYFPVAGAKVAVLVAPGNAGNRVYRAPMARALTARGLSVLLLEYRGYGGNPGEPSEDGLKLDIRAAHDFLAREAGAPLVYFGESLGSAVVTELAVERPPSALVLRSPFVDLASVGRLRYPFLPVRWLLRDEFPTRDDVARVQAPVTVVYGAADSIVPAQQSREVARAAGARTVEVPGAEHNDPAFSDGPELIDAIADAIR